ncbi:MAG: tRNA pseudouridine(55) synthase TruB [Sandaracinaceae bacterium]|nr:tRNA pseudouridine(55) synthase TruB [Sandaracinaceae bacterium]
MSKPTLRAISAMQPTPFIEIVEERPILKEGFVLPIDKPKGPTSHDCVEWARRALGIQAVGHSGTLDPMASGLLILAVSKGTKLVPYLTEENKVYQAVIALGVETDTLDTEGTPIRSAPVPILDLQTVREVASRFVGRYFQKVPLFSAIKVRGQALHRLARQGKAEQIEPPAREVIAHAVEVIGLEAGRIALRLDVGKGYYVRSLARDLANALGTVGHLAELRRLQSGRISVDAAIDGRLLEQAAQGKSESWQSLKSALVRAAIPLARAIQFEKIQAPPSWIGRIANGQPLPIPQSIRCIQGKRYAILHNEELLGIGQCDGSTLRLLRVLCH